MPPPEDSSRPVSKLILHVIDEMPWRYVPPLGLLAFFFFFGAANGLIKLTGRDVASIDFPLGPVVGIFSALAVMILCIIIKLRPKP